MASARSALNPGVGGLLTHRIRVRNVKGGHEEPMSGRTGDRLGRDCHEAHYPGRDSLALSGYVRGNHLLVFSNKLRTSSTAARKRDAWTDTFDWLARGDR